MGDDFWTLVILIMPDKSASPSKKKKSFCLPEAICIQFDLWIWLEVK